MSQTVINRPLHLKGKDLHTKLVLDNLSGTNSTKDSPGEKSEIITSPYDLICTSEGSEECTPDDLRHFEAMSQRLSREVVPKQDFRKELDKIRESMKKVFVSPLPPAVKAKAMESLMDALKTKMNCIRETNRVIKGKIINIEKNNSYKTQLNIIHGSTPKNASKDTSNMIKQGFSPSKLGIGRNGAKAKTHLGTATTSPFAGEVDDVKQESKKLEETIAELKQTRNSLAMSIEDTRDDWENMQALIKEKKNALDRKIRCVEESKLKISNNSVKRSNSRSGNTSHRKTNSEIGSFTLRNYLSPNKEVVVDSRNDLSTSRFNTSMLQEVSSKLGQVFGKIGKMGKVFRGKKEETVPDQILTSDFMRELDMQNTPASLNNSRTYNGPGHHSMVATKPKSHGRNLSISNLFYDRGSNN